ncbi:MAG: sterol desaturase family protein [Bdellovibrionia bacterium]
MMLEKLMNLPNPVELFMDPASLIVVGIFFLILLLEAVFPARPLPKVRFWKSKGLFSFVIYFYLSSYLPLIWNHSLTQFQLLDLTFLGDLGGAAVALLTYQLGVYLWHRAMHQFQPLWRTFHQLHHSAERFDSYGAFFFSPMDMIGFTFLTSLAWVVLGGFTVQATIYALYGATFLAVIQHANIRTPLWMGYLFQRPESHSLHHARGIHAHNYSDLPVFDILFRTFQNPREFSEKTGFYDGASSRIGDMILFRDINS